MLEWEFVFNEQDGRARGSAFLEFDTFCWFEHFQGIFLFFSNSELGQDVGLKATANLQLNMTEIFNWQFSLHSLIFDFGWFLKNFRMKSIITIVKWLFKAFLFSVAAAGARVSERSGWFSSNFNSTHLNFEIQEREMFWRNNFNNWTFVEMSSSRNLRSSWEC